MAEYAEQYGHRERGEETPTAVWRFAETVGGALFSPGPTLRSVAQREAIMPALLLVFLVVVISVSGQVATVLAGLARAAGTDAAFFGDGRASLLGFQLMGILWNLIWGPVLWTVAAGLLFGIAYLLGGRGRFAGLWAATGFALAPQLLVAPLAPMTEAAGALGPGWQVFGFVLAAPVYLLGFIWTLALLAIAVREAMNLSGGRAFASVAILIGAFLLLIVLMICVFVLLIIGLVAAAT